MISPRLPSFFHYCLLDLLRDFYKRVFTVYNEGMCKLIDFFKCTGLNYSHTTLHCKGMSLSNTFLYIVFRHNITPVKKFVKRFWLNILKRGSGLYFKYSSSLFKTHLCRFLIFYNVIQYFFMTVYKYRELDRISVFFDCNSKIMRGILTPFLSIKTI